MEHESVYLIVSATSPTRLQLCGAFRQIYFVCTPIHVISYVVKRVFVAKKNAGESVSFTNHLQFHRGMEMATSLELL